MVGRKVSSSAGLHYCMVGLDPPGAGPQKVHLYPQAEQIHFPFEFLACFVQTNSCLRHTFPFPGPVGAAKLTFDSSIPAKTNDKMIAPATNALAMLMFEKVFTIIPFLCKYRLLLPSLEPPQCAKFTHQIHYRFERGLFKTGSTLNVRFGSLADIVEGSI